MKKFIVLAIMCFGSFAFARAGVEPANGPELVDCEVTVSIDGEDLETRKVSLNVRTLADFVWANDQKVLMIKSGMANIWGDAYSGQIVHGLFPFARVIRISATVGNAVDGNKLNELEYSINGSNKRFDCIGRHSGSWH